MDAEPDRLTAFVLQSRTYFCRWHEGEASEDAVLADSSGCWAFSTVADCLGSWPSWRPDLTEAPASADYDAVRAWLAGQPLAMPADDLLNVWNFTGDVARGTGLSWWDRGLMADRVFEKLTAAAVPWAFGMEAYSPRWSPRELVVARGAAMQAVHIALRAMSLNGKLPPSTIR